MSAIKCVKKKKTGEKEATRRKRSSSVVNYNRIEMLVSPECWYFNGFTNYIGNMVDERSILSLWENFI
jgi:predicted metalloprotease with PDZ domain